ncbi:MAG: threonine 3-dehydrogenase [Clostridia bacterium]|nr:threonine 3-dehydrogenase [Clostridia bacterium]
MKAIVKDKPEAGATLQTVDIPQIGPRDVLVKVKAASICGTDLHIYNWDKWASSRMNIPIIIGHEMAGEVVEVGSEVESCKIGDYVSLECHKTCGICFQCRTGKGHICQNYTIQGVDFDGCFAEYVKVPEANIWKNNPSIPPEIACLQDPMGNAVMAVLADEITGKSVAVIGCGAIGLFAVGIARASGASKVYAIDLNEYRLNIAKKMGADVILNPSNVDVTSVISQNTNKEGIDVVLEMSGNEIALHEGLKMVKNGGRVSLLGIPDEQVSLDLANEVVFKGITIVGITGREIYGTWYKTSSFLSGGLDVSPIITHQLKLEDYEEGFEIMRSGQCGKVILYP